MYAHISGAPGAGESAVFTLNIGGADRTLTVTISGAADQDGSDLTHQEGVTQGDLLAVKVVTSIGCATIYVYVTFELSLE